MHSSGGRDKLSAFRSIVVTPCSGVNVDVYFNVGRFILVMEKAPENERSFFADILGIVGKEMKLRLA